MNNFNFMKGLRNSKKNSALLISISYMFIGTSSQVANIASILYLNESYQGFLTQGFYHFGLLIGSIFSLSLSSSLSLPKALMTCALLVSLYSIIFPLNDLEDQLEFIIILIVLSVLSGLGASFILLVHAKHLCRLQKTNKRSPFVGLFNMLINLFGVFSGFLFCVPSIFDAKIEV